CQMQRTPLGLVYVDQYLGNAKKRPRNLSSNYEPGGREFESLRARQLSNTYRAPPAFKWSMSGQVLNISIRRFGRQTKVLQGERPKRRLQ
ncbi:MAG TPA: hypothetical protein VGN03_02245, partial [Steroidobacteraceae bacterium]